MLFDTNDIVCHATIHKKEPLFSLRLLSIRMRIVIGYYLFLIIISATSTKRLNRFFKKIGCTCDWLAFTSAPYL